MEPACTADSGSSRSRLLASLAARLRFLAPLRAGPPPARRHYRTESANPLTESRRASLGTGLGELRTP
jgi:hypothetical protein